jgi:hypothetical protein
VEVVVAYVHRDEPDPDHIELPETEGDQPLCPACGSEAYVSGEGCPDCQEDPEELRLLEELF